ncbi:MAG: hypothetical protein ABH824_05720 [Nanoarchaeota archaeon]
MILLTKKYGECMVCGTKRLINFADLCKRCTSKSESHDILNEALAEQREIREKEEEETHKRLMESAESASAGKKEEPIVKEEPKKGDKKEEKADKKEK